MPNDCHWAVVVGIDRYPGFKDMDLSCPRRDAAAFRSWLIDPAGGDVPDGNVELISVELPKKVTIRGAKPTNDAIYKAIQAAYLAAGKKAKGALWHSTRLYLFFSGHGIAMNREDASLLAADADDENPGRHVSWSGLKEFFTDHPYFKELVVFSDCCSDDYTQKLKSFSSPPWRRGAQVGGGSPRTFFIGAAEFGQKAFEEDSGPLTERSSHFTRCLLEIMHGDTGLPTAITAHEIQNEMKRLYSRLQKAGKQVGEMRIRIDDPDMKFGLTGKGREYLTELKVNGASGVRVVGDGAPIQLDPNGEPGTFTKRIPAGIYQVELSTDGIQYQSHPTDLHVIPGYNFQQL